MNKKILVTGGSGFIGTYLVQDILDQGHDVVIYDKAMSTDFPDRCIQADVRDRDKLTKSLSGMDVVFNLAAEHRDDIQPVSLYYDVNVGGAQNLVHACEQNNIKHIIFTSTVALYGLNAGIPNENSPIKPFNDYGKSKHQSESVFQAWVRENVDRSLTIVRPTVIFGEKNRGNVFNLLNQMASGKFIMVGSGENKKSMGYVCNLSKFLTLTVNNEPGTHVFNYTDQPDFTMNELVKLVNQTLSNGSSSSFRLPYAIGLAGGYMFDALAKVMGKQLPISAIRIKKFCANTMIEGEKVRQTGFVSPYTLEEGLQRMIEHEFGVKRET